MRLFNWTAIVAFSFYAQLSQAAPTTDFQAITYEGRTIKGQEFKGHYLVLEWFNENCPYTQKHYTSQNMQKLQQKYGAKNVKWLTVNSSAHDSSGAMKLSQVRTMQKKWKPSYTYLINDESGELGKKFGATTTPHLFIFSPDQKLIYQGAIDNNSSSRPETIPGSLNYVEETLEAAFQNKPAPHTETKPYGCSVKYAD